MFMVESTFYRQGLVVDMEIIQASCSTPSLFQPPLRRQSRRISTGIDLNSRFSPNSSILFLKPEFPQRAVSGATTTRAVLENSTSGENRVLK